jgi:intracellular septation protein A
MIDQALGTASLVAAVAALSVYLWIVVRRAQMIRLLTGLGLFLTGLALFQGPSILSATKGDLNVRIAVVCLILAVVVQIGSLLRTRPSWTGTERRSEAGPQ